MTPRAIHWLWLLVLIAALFFGCSRRPGEKLYTQALEQWEMGNLVRARTLLEKSIRRRTGSEANADAYNRLGLLLWEMGETQSAADAFSESLRIDAGQHDVLCNLGVALCSAKDFPAAEKAFREAALLRPDDTRPLAYAGVAFAQNKKWSEAYRNLRKAVLINPNNPQLQTAMALAELQQTDPQAALKRLRTVTQKYPDYAPALFNMGAIYSYKLQRPAEARIWFERYLNASSGIDAFSAFARTRIQTLSQPSAAPTLAYNRPTTRNRDVAQAHFSRAVTLHRAGKTPEAIRAYIQTIEADDSYERAFYNLGLAYYADGQMPLAGEAFSKAVQLNPAYTDARYNLALVNHYHLGNTPKALRELQTVLSQKPDHQPAADLLARIKK